MMINFIMYMRILMRIRKKWKTGKSHNKNRDDFPILCESTALFGCIRHSV